MIAAEAIFTDVWRAWREVRNRDAGVVSAFASHNLTAGERIDAPQQSRLGQVARNPTCFQSREVCTRKLTAKQTRYVQYNEVSAPVPMLPQVILRSAEIHNRLLLPCSGRYGKLFRLF
jgi:hypothetical protein